MVTVQLPVRRPFSWPVFFWLVALYFLSNLAGIPLLRKTNMPWELLGASFKAGVTEEIVSRLFLVSLLVWSMVLVPVFLQANTLLWMALIVGLSLAIVVLGRALWPAGRVQNTQV